MTHPDFHIRAAAPTDIDKLASLLAQLFAIEGDFVIDGAKQRRGLILLLEQPDSKVLVAERQKEVVAMCTLQRLVSTAEGGYVGLIEDVAVDRDCRGLGIGRALLAEMERYARNKGLLRIQLLVDNNNPAALRFYRRNRWQETALQALKKY